MCFMVSDWATTAIQKWQKGLLISSGLGVTMSMKGVAYIYVDVYVDETRNKPS